jgi:transglutaminase-like putative cysteine protease
MNDKHDLSIYLKPTYFIDSNSPAIIEYANKTCHRKDSEIDRAIALYYAVRDDIRYDPYSVEDKRESVRASSVLKEKLVSVLQKQFFWQRFCALKKSLETSTEK